MVEQAVQPGVITPDLGWGDGAADAGDKRDRWPKR
jgi:hypothetical protein